jgi:TatD DNase family protein
MLVDSHVHLDRYPAAEVRAMLWRATEARVEHLLTVGVDLPSSRSAVALSRRYPGVSAAVGVHPTRVERLRSSAATLRALSRLATADEVVAIGEIGLDAQTGRESLDDQAAFVRNCLDLAHARQLPIVLHVVDSHDAALAILHERASLSAPVRGVVHYFVGDANLARRYLDLGLSISVGKPVTRPSERAVRDAVATIPHDRLLLETDTYPLPGRTTEPRDVAAVCAAVAEIRGIDAADVAAETTANYRRLFSSRRPRPA